MFNAHGITLPRMLFVLMGLSTLTISVSQADSALISSNSANITLNQAANGVPVVNIAKPNPQGLSHNVYSQFNVGAQGLILNNSNAAVATQLGGYVVANPHLTGGMASVIVNEVVEPNPSMLKGYLEVAGQKASVIVANPYGLTCDACGFINSNKATLSTGRPIFDDKKIVKGYEVQEGNLLITGGGLNGSNTDKLNIFTRALALNADIYANHLNIVTGKNTLDAEGKILQSDSSVRTDKPLFYSIDSSALGGMYANAITLVGTEAGIGMRLDGPLVAQKGSLEITSGGQVRFSQISTAADVKIAAKQIDLSQSAIFSGRNLLLNAQESIDIGNQIEAKGDVQFNAINIFIGDNGFVAAQGNIKATGGSLTNHGIIFSENNVQFSIHDDITNGSLLQNTGAAILAKGNITLSGLEGGRVAALKNYGALIESWSGDISVKADSLTNQSILWQEADAWVENLAPVYTDDCAQSIYCGGASISQWMYTTSGFHCCYVEGVNNPSSVLFESGFYWPRNAKQWENTWLYREKEVITHHDIESYGVRANIIASQQGQKGGKISIDATIVDNDRATISAASVLSVNAATIFNTATALQDDFVKTKDKSYKECPHDGDCIRVNGSSQITQGNYLARNEQTIPAVLEGFTVALYGSEVKNGQNGKLGKIREGGSSSDASALWDKLPASLAQSLAAGGLFHLTPPDHPYRIEIDPRLATYQGFLGSAYLLNQLNWLPNITQRRLGDSSYELMLIRDSLIAATGSRFLDPMIADEKAQFEYLMQNAVAASEPLRLTPGIALSKAQIDALEQDIVWLEERQIFGEKLLVPVVYLAKGSSRILNNGAIINGSDVLIDADELFNYGDIKAKQDLSVTAKNKIDNQSGHLSAAGDLVLQSGGDVVNTSGTISANNVYIDAKGDIIQQTDSARQSHQVGLTQSWSTQMGEEASVTATEQLVMKAGGDIRLTAARLKGQDITLDAQDITVDTVAVEQGYRYHNGGWREFEEQLNQLTSQIEASHKISMQAERNINMIAATLQSGGDIQVVANEGSIHLLAAENRQQSDTSMVSSGHVDRSYHASQSISQLQGSQIQAQGNLALSAGQDVVLFASNAGANQQVDVQAGRDIQIIAGVDTQQQSISSTKKGKAAFENHQQGFIQQTAVVSGIYAGGDMNISSQNNVSLIASQLQAANTLRVGGEEVNQSSLKSMSGSPLNLSIGTLALSNESWNEKQTGFSGPLKAVLDVASLMVMTNPVFGLQVLGASNKVPQITTSQSEKNHQNNELALGSDVVAKDLRVRVKETAALVGSTINVENKTDIKANNIVIDAAEERSFSTYQSGKTTTKSLGIKLGTDEVRLAGLERTKEDSQNTQSTLSLKGSQINTGSLTLNAEDEIHLLSSEVNVTGDANLRAGNAINIGGHQGRTETTSQQTRETTTVSASVRNAYLDAALSVKALSDAKDAVKKAEQDLSDAKYKASKGELSAEDIQYFEANLVAAAANSMQIGIEIAATVATAGEVAASTAGTGFYVAGKANRESVKTIESQNQESWQGSQVTVAGNITVNADEKITVKGSDIHADKTLFLESKVIELLAVDEKNNRSSNTQQNSQSVSLSGNGTANASVGQHDSNADSNGITYINSHLTGGTVITKSDRLTLNGALIEGNHVNVAAGELSIGSVQDRQFSQSKSNGGSLGVGISAMGLASATVSADYQRSHSEREWVSEQSGIIGHESIQVKAKDTVLNGGIIAHAIRGEDGALSDQGNLYFETETLKFSDIKDYDNSKTIGANLSVGKNISNNAKSSLSNITIGGIYEGHVKDQITHATVGEGIVIVGGKTLDINAAELNLSGLNRDISKAQELIRDQDTGGLNANVSVDGRWFTEAGREEMKTQAKNIGENWQLNADGLARGVEVILPSDIAENSFLGKVSMVVDSLGIPTTRNNGGLVSKLADILGSPPIHSGTMQQRDKEDPYAIDNPEIFINGDTARGFRNLEGPGQDFLSNRMITGIGFELNSENSTYLNGVNGMLNAEANAYVNILEQTTDISVLHSRSHSAVTNNYIQTNGLLADGVGALFQSINILANSYVLGPIGDLFGFNANVSISGESKVTEKYLINLVSARKEEGAIIDMHSRGNQDITLALQKLGKDFFPKNTTTNESKYLFIVNGAPVSGSILRSVIENSGAALIVMASNKGDQISGVIGGNKGDYVAQANGKSYSSSLMSSIQPYIEQPKGRLSNLFNISQWGNLGSVKYPVYTDIDSKNLTYIKPSLESEPLKKSSSHSMYNCKAGALCGDAFGDPVKPPKKVK